ncbi:MAG: tetratricopeptide repeat protein [Woeseiaceae bacterium]|nr:tetratricopeptide repeat protein [Woeseiaceae bacterium]
MASVWEELKRRNVVRVAIAYAVVGWLILQVADVILNNVAAPAWAFQAILLLLAIGFPLTMVIAWVYELTPEGVRKEKDIDRSDSISHITGRKLDLIIIGVLAVAVAFLLVDKIYLSKVTTVPAGTLVSQRKSIAVLPFINLSDDPGNEYFSDGIAEEILNLLAKIPQLRVTSRSSAFSFKGQNLDVPTMAARLKVDHVLEGSVRKSGDQVRITAQLIDVGTDTHLWSETYDRKMENIFAIQDEISAAVVNALQVTLLREPPHAAETDPEAYALFLQGRHLAQFVNLSAGSLSRAETILKQALALDPGFASAWVELARVYLHQAMIFGIPSFEEGGELARDAVQRALQIDPRNGRALGVLAAVKGELEWDFEGAYETIRQALILDPGNAEIMQVAARAEYVLGRLDAAIDIYRKAMTLDPLSGHIGLAVVLHSAGRLDQAMDVLETAKSLNPGASVVNHWLALVQLAQGDAPAARETIELEPDEGWRLIGLPVIEYALGNIEASDAALAELIDKFGSSSALQIAEAYAYRGEIDNAFEWLDRAYDNRDPGMTNLLVTPLLANLHDDPRWEPLLDRMGLPH